MESLYIYLYVCTVQYIYHILSEIAFKPPGSLYSFLTLTEKACDSGTGCQTIMS